MDKESELIQVIREFFSAGDLEFENARYTVAGVSYAKAVFLIIDLIILRKTGLLPDNHEKRFKFVEFRFPELYSTLSDVFRLYRETYRKMLSKEDAEFLRGVAYELARKAGIT